MYLPRHFEVSDARVLRDFIRAHPLATLVIADASGLSADHIPLLLEGDDDRGWTLAGHVARANPVWKKALRLLFPQNDLHLQGYIGNSYRISLYF